MQTNVTQTQNTNRNVGTLETDEGVHVDVSDLVAVQLQGVEKCEVGEHTCRNLPQVVVRQSQ